jgi:O-antigen/teichoic acid export membrane protein
MNRYKKLAANTMVFAIGSFGSKILLLLLTRLYTGNISTGDNSTKELLEITANFLIPIITFSITEAVIRYGLVSDYKKKEIFSSACVIEMCGLGILLLITPIIYLLPYTDNYELLLITYVITSSLHALFAQFVRARGMVKLFAFDGIFATLTLFIFNIIFIASLHLGVTGFMMSVILSDFLSAVFLFFVARLWNFFSFRAVKKDIAKMMLKFSIPLIPTAVLWIITGFSDRLFIRYMKGPENLVGASAAGIYGVSTKIPNLVSTVSTIFFQAWNMSAIMENKSEDKGKFYEQIFSAYQSMMFIASAFLIGFVKILSAILIDTSTYDGYSSAYIYTPILVIAVLMMCFNQFLSSVYTASQKTTHSFWTALITAIINIILNFVLIYKMGIMGAVLATFISYFICYLIRIVDARKLIYFDVSHIKFIVNTICLFALSFLQMYSPKYYIIFTAVVMLFMIVYNFKAILLTVKKILKKG